MRTRLGLLLATGLAATGLALTAGGADAADATISVSPSPVAPDGTLTVSGTGCAAASPVSLRVWATSGGPEINTSTTADAAGAFTTEIPLENTFDVDSEIGAIFYCGDLFDESVPNAVDYVRVEVATNGVAVSFSPASPRYGQRTVATVVSTPSGAPGTSSLWVDGDPVGSGEPAGGTVELVLPTLGVGEHDVTVEFDPDAEGATTATAAATLTVRKATSTMRLKIADRTLAKGQRAKATVRVSSGSATPTGVVVLRDGRTTLTSLALLASDHGKKVVRFALRGAGKHPITAVYQGSEKVAGDRSPRIVVKVAR